MRLCFLLIALLILLPYALALRFTEVMYDPAGSDTGREYVELEAAEDLNGWLFGDVARNGTLALLQRNESNGYILIVPSGFNYSGLGCTIYTPGKTLGNNLNNDGDAIYIYDSNGSLVATTNYTNIGGDNNGYSLEWINDSWREGSVIGGTPCAEYAPLNTTNITIANTTTNITAANTTNATDITLTNATNTTINSTNNTRNRTAHDISLAVALPPTIYSSVPYDSLFRVRDERHAAGTTSSINVTIAYNVSREGVAVLNAIFLVIINYYTTANTGHLFLNETGNYTLCGLILSATENGAPVPDDNATNDAACLDIAVADPFLEPCNVSLAIEFAEEKPFYEAGDHVRFWNRVTRHDNGSAVPPFIINYQVEDLFGHTLSVKTTENDNQKSYTPTVEGELGAYLFRSSFAMLACNNTNHGTGDERLVVVRGLPAERSSASSLAIVGIGRQADGFEPGDVVAVDLDIYRGDTAKYSVKLWAEDPQGKRASAVASLHAEQRFTGYEVTLPLALKPEIKPGEYRIVIEGLDERDEERITVKAKGRATEQNETLSTGHAAISSFYTRNRKAADNINLYATIKGEGSVTLELIGLATHVRQPTRLQGSYAFKGNVTMFPGPNILVLRVLDDEGGTVAERSLLLEMNGTDIVSVDHFTLTPAPCSCTDGEVAKRAPQGTAAPRNVTQKNGSNQSSSPMTGSAVAYTSKSSVPLLPILFGVIGLLLLGIVLQRRR
jgi:hypothetical protein